MVAVVRLCVVPIAVSASIAARDDVVREPAFLAVAAAVFLYAAGLWLLVRRRRAPGVRVTDLGDVIALALLVIVANPHDAAAGRFPYLLALIAWALGHGPRAVLLRGGVVGVAICAAEALRFDLADAGSVAVFVVVDLLLCFAIARYIEHRSARMEALERRAAELQAEVGDLERRERARIAQLLHDDALQRLLSARQDLEQGLDGDGDAEAMRRASEGLQEATRALRSLTFVANDDALRKAGLDSAIRRLAQEAEDRSSLAATVVVDPDLDGDLGGTILPIVRELVANVERHARASTLRVSVQRVHGGIAITVADDGQGVAPADLILAEQTGHLGISGLRRRVEALRGTLEIRGEAGVGTTVRVELSDVDIRAQQALEDALRNEREWNAALVAGLPDPFVVCTADLRVVEVSDRFIETTGWPRAQLLASPAGQLPYLTPERIQVILHRSPEEEARTYVYEQELICKDGRRLEVLVSVRHIRDPRGQRQLRLVTFRDITERRLQEQRLREERDLSSAIREAMQEPFIQTRDGVVVRVNDAFCGLSGYPTEQLVGAVRPYFFFAPDSVEEAFAYAARLERDGLATGQLRLLRADGQTVPVFVRGVAVRDQKGRTIGRVQTATAVGLVPPLGPILPRAAGARALAPGE